MGNIPLFCWGDDFDPKVDKDGYLAEPPRKIAPERMKKTISDEVSRESRNVFSINVVEFDQHISKK